MYQWRNSHWL